ncbi:MAG: restriction endonuclease subunit S [Lachnospiraceae bacterium]|nr:restriction endonuclease subunit S [Lachnospiraceae bacterium]
MNEYKIVKITDLGTVNRGKSKHRPRNDSILYGGEYPFIQTGDVKKANLHLVDYTQTYNDVGLKQSKLWKKGTLCFTIAANIADSAILGMDACFPDSIVGFLPYENVSDTTYVKYLFDELKLYFQQISKGTTQDNLSLDKICRVKLRVPDYDTQVKVASILSTYDTAIENNNKRIRLLEQMAENLYKEWFVRFRFPRYEDVEFKDSPLGKIPTIFDVVKIGTLIDYYIGGGWGEEEASEQFSQEAFVVRGTDFPNVRYGVLNSCPLRYHKPSNYKKRKFEVNDIAFEVSGGTQEQPVGRSIMITKRQLGRFNNKLICASFCKQIRCNPQKINPRYLYHWLQYMYNTRMIDQFQLQSTGIINFKFEYFLRKGNVLMPPPNLMDDFTTRVEQFYEEIDILSEQNTKLVAQRDYLLPRLMSGKLEV